MAIEQGEIFIVSGPRFFQSHPKDHSNKVAFYDKEGALSQTELAKKNPQQKQTINPHKEHTTVSLYMYMLL